MRRRPKIIGHRGWPSRYPANTLAGLIAAGSVADGVEVDVRRSKDGKLVLAHDPTIGGLVVADTPWSALAEEDLGDGHRPTLLDEALASLPSTSVLIEIKNDPAQPGYEPDHRLALDSAERSRPGDALISFNPATVDAVRSNYRDVATGIVLGRRRAVADVARHCLSEGHGLLVLEHPLVDGRVDEIAPGLKVFAWTVNDRALAAELARLGVSGIITDDPDSVATIWSEQ